MRAVLEGAARLAVARAPRGAHPDRESGRSGAGARAARLIAAIVAGGAASRFAGEPKGLHTVGGQRIIDRIAAALTSVVPELILITSAAGAESWLPGVRVIPDAWRKQGSLVGIHTALRYAEQPILLVAWDMPFVTRALFEL
ncbi:MAG: NTP transferase domain-containing protein, partial [Solirubrobacteraceae bacterium]